MNKRPLVTIMARLWFPSKKGIQKIRTRWIDVVRLKHAGDDYLNPIEFKISWTEDDVLGKSILDDREMNTFVDPVTLLYVLQEMYPELNITFKDK